MASDVRHRSVRSMTMDRIERAYGELLVDAESMVRQGQLSMHRGGCVRQRGAVHHHTAGLAHGLVPLNTVAV